MQDHVAADVEDAEESGDGELVVLFEVEDFVAVLVEVDVDGDGGEVDTFVHHSPP